MKTTKRMLVGLAMAAMVIPVLPTFGAGDDDNPNYFVRMAMKSPDGKISKSMAMAHVEKMFDKHDTRKEGKLDRNQIDAFLKELMRSPG